MVAFHNPALAALLAATLAAPALAGPGDVHETTPDLVNLRDSPSDAASVRDRLEGGTQVIELRRDGGWLRGACRPDRPGGLDLWRAAAAGREDSALSDAEGTAGFGTYSRDLNSLLFQVNERLGATMIAEVTEDGRTLTLTPTESWLRVSSQDAQLLAVTAIYGMWKNHQNQSPVDVVLLDTNGDQYIVIRDEGEAGPQLTVIDQASGSER